jgi:CubicO group peptidase (beta-lactamase class C family)
LVLAAAQRLVIGQRLGDDLHGFLVAEQSRPPGRGRAGGRLAWRQQGASHLAGRHHLERLERNVDGFRINGQRLGLDLRVGVAIAQGKIESLETPIASFFPNLLGDSADPARRAITIEDLVSMRAGLESTSGRNYGRWVHSGNWVKHILSRPLEADPGGLMIYSTGTTHLLSAILTKATGASTRDFAQEVLAGPLGFDLAPWPRDPQGIYFGGNDMVLSPRQMLAFGEMYLHHGRANGKQIVPESWVEASWVPRTRSRRSGRMYGYGWWMRELGGVWAYYAWGYGGQFIFVVPKLETVVVTTSADTPGEGRRGHLGEVYDLVGRLILEPIATGGEVLPLEHRAD